MVAETRRPVSRRRPGDSVELRGLPALSADGKTLISRAESNLEDPLIETLRATTWGGVRQSYDFAAARYESVDESQLLQIRAGAKRLKRMLARRDFSQIKITSADRTGLVKVGDYSVQVHEGKLQFLAEGKLVYARRIKKRSSRGAGLMSDKAYDELEVDFVGAYVDPVRRVFVVSYGLGRVKM